MTFLLPAPVFTAREGIASRTIKRGFRGDDFLLQAGDGHDYFIDGPRGVLALNGPVLQRMGRVSRDAFPAFRIDPPGEQVGVEIRFTDHRQDISVPRVQGHHRPAFSNHGLLGRFLHFQVQG